MAEKIEQIKTITTINKTNETVKMRKSPEMETKTQQLLTNSGHSLARERSFIRPTNHQNNNNKRRSLAFNIPTNGNQSSHQQRVKTAGDIYRTSNVQFGNGIQHSSSTSMMFPAVQQMPYIPASNLIISRRQAGLSFGNMPLTNVSIKPHNIQNSQRSILVTHSHTVPMNNISQPQPQVTILNSSSAGHITNNTNRVKFAPSPPKFHNNKNQNTNQYSNNHYNHQHHHQQQQQQQQKQYINQYIVANHGSTTLNPYLNIPQLQRSKSLSSADAFARGIASLGLGLDNEVKDIGQFEAEVQNWIDIAIEDPNKLNSRSLIELTSQFIKRAVEGRRYALPISRLCLNIISKEQKETFLEALLNACRQWYQEREKLLFSLQGMKSPSRARFTAFMAFLTEMFCQLKRRQLHLRTQYGETSPPLILLTLLGKCCEDCVKPPVRSLSEIESLFYVLTCIGQDLEKQLPQQLELLLSMIRDAFLNANDSAPTIRRTLLQLIELHASNWQLPGNTVLYYYPSAK